jgi:RHS repeat-associated protein
MLNYGASGTGLDGEGRVTQVTAQAGQNPVTGVTYVASGTTQPIGAITQVTYGSADSDNFSYSPYTGALNSYVFHVGSQTVTGNLTWNANGSLQQLQISDQLNAANSQTCTYLYDDLGRIGLPPGSIGKSVDCGATKWQQIFSYDAFGNIKKTVPTGGTGVSFTPTYATGTSRYTSLPGFTPTYDANGDLTADGSHSFAWDAEGHPVTIDTVGLTYDAMGRMVEQQRGSSYTQILYGPTGKFALMNGQTLLKGFAPLPGGGTAVYTPSVLPAYYRHADWLSSSRLATTPSRTVYYDAAYAPFGEPYVETGTTDRNFTSQNQDTVSGLHDFMFREYDPSHGRWMSPDPAGPGAANQANPQTWNRYAYVNNGPLNSLDPMGLFRDDAFGGGGICIEGPACASGPYGSSTYIVNGIQVPPMVARSLLSMQAAVVCPSCKSGQFVGADNKIYQMQWIPPYNLSFDNGFTINHTTGHFGILSVPNGDLQSDSVGLDIWHCPGCATTWNSAYTWGKAAFIGTAVVAGGGLAGGALSSGAAENLVDPLIANSDKVLGQGDLYHNFGELIGQEAMQSGELAVQNGSYMQWNISGFVNGTAGVFQYGGILSTAGTVLYVTHTYFEAF